MDQITVAWRNHRVEWSHWATVRQMRIVVLWSTFSLNFDTASAATGEILQWQTKCTCLRLQTRSFLSDKNKFAIESTAANSQRQKSLLFRTYKVNF